MPSFDLQIKNGRILHNGDLVEVDISISAGKIANIEKNSVGSTARTIDARGLVILPGLIDPHVHFRDPGQTYKEDFLSGTRGAVAGGTTTVFDMPNTSPAVSSPQILREKARLVEKKSVANFSLVAGASPENLRYIDDLSKAGAIAFKTYMIAPPKGSEREYAGTFVTDSGQLLETMREVRKTGLIHCIHAESNASVSFLTGELRREKRKDPLAHYDARPNFVEEEAVADVLILAEHLGSRIHIVHVSTSEAIDQISEAQRKGVDVSCETCPQYMIFSKEILGRKGPLAKFNPPPRNPEDGDRLIKAVTSGEVDMISTDHAPHSMSEKQRGFDDIFNAPSGTPGVETRLPLLLKMVHQGRLALGDIPRLCSSAVAERFGISNRKGAVRVGLDADLVLIDFNADWTIRASEMQTKAWETVLYDGMEVKGRVKFTIVNGQVAYEDGTGFASPGIGEMIRAPVNSSED